MSINSLPARISYSFSLFHHYCWPTHPPLNRFNSSTCLDPQVKIARSIRRLGPRAPETVSKWQLTTFLYLQFSSFFFPPETRIYFIRGTTSHCISARLFPYAVWMRGEGQASVISGYRYLFIGTLIWLGQRHQSWYRLKHLRLFWFGFSLIF